MVQNVQISGFQFAASDFSGPKIYDLEIYDRPPHPPSLHILHIEKKSLPVPADPIHQSGVNWFDCDIFNLWNTDKNTFIKSFHIKIHGGYNFYLLAIREHVAFYIFF